MTGVCFKWQIRLVNFLRYSSSFGFVSSGANDVLTVNLLAFSLFVGRFFAFLNDKIFYFTRLCIRSWPLNPNTWATRYTILTTGIYQILQSVHGSCNMLTSPISTAFTLTSCLEYTAAVRPSAL